MLYPMSPKVVELKRRLESFMDRHIYPNEERFYREAEELGPWKVYPVVLNLERRRARKRIGPLKAIPPHSWLSQWPQRTADQRFACPVSKVTFAAAFAVLEGYHHEQDSSRFRRDFGRFSSLARLCRSAL